MAPASPFSDYASPRLSVDAGRASDSAHTALLIRDSPALLSQSQPRRNSTSAHSNNSHIKHKQLPRRPPPSPASSWSYGRSAAAARRGSGGSSGKAWGRKLPAFLALVSLVGLLALAGRSSRASELDAELRSRLEVLKDTLLTGTGAGSSRPLNDPSRPVRKYKYAGSRKAPRTTYQALDLSEVLNHRTPQATLRAQLKEGVRYVYALPFGGHANEFLGIQNLLALSERLSRVAIIPTLMPVHIDGPPIAMSAFYDLDRFWVESGIASVEMSAMKELDANQEWGKNERLTCWSTQFLAEGRDTNNGFGTDVHDIAVDFWPLPEMARTINERDISFEALTIFDNEWRTRWDWNAKVQREGLPLATHGGKTVQGFNPKAEPPSDQLVCYDNALFTGPLTPEPAYGGKVPLEDLVKREDSAWIEVGQHLHFTKEIESLADSYLVDLFDCKDASKIPPFLSIHLRRGDFKEFTGFTDLDRYLSALTRLRTRTQSRLDNPFTHRGPFLQNFRHFNLPAEQYPIVVTTDELPGTPFWQEVERIGWKIVNHEAARTKERLGPWHMTMIDSAILARGQGFVGTAESTFSELAGLRVKYWSGGMVERAR